MSDSSPRLEEVRVAMALNGGVSLAVWMGGCSVELDCARRAFRGSESLEAHIPPRRVYHAICDAFQRRLVLDLMSGASAGAVNGALLAAAITKGRRLHPDFVRREWVEIGDLQTLLQPTSVAKPTALLQGAHFHDALLEAFEVLLAPASDADPLVVPDPPVDPQDCKLDVTTTDLTGVPRTFRDSWGGELVAREYRARFRFRERDDFQAKWLAQAARSSASFPIAFEPWLPRDGSWALAGSGDAHWVVDGGLLDNAPIRAALELIPGQPATTEVTRYLCYVNADPDSAEREPFAAGGPTLPQIVGAVVTLPPAAPFVDHLAAVERATRRSTIGDSAELLRLVMLDHDSLVQIAAGLLPVYRRRRLLLSLEDVLGSPAQAAAVFERLRDASGLPWIPDSFSPQLPGWRWGVRAAQRILYLQLDLLRAAIERQPLDGRGDLLQARTAITERVALLEETHQALRSSGAVREILEEVGERGFDPAIDPRRLAEATVGYAHAASEHVRAATQVLHGVAAELADLGGSELVDALFGSGPVASAIEHFVVRALGIEVVRRAFFDEEDVDSAQPLRFVALTPQTPSPIFAVAADTPGPNTAQEKLTGIELAHFAAFYRRSWRVNDFMWGRLDGAARVVDMLVDPARATELDRLRGGVRAVWAQLAGALMPDDADETLRWVVHDALGGTGAIPAAGVLRTTLGAAICDDLLAKDGGRLTRDVCTRAAQLEILGHELPILVQESEGDAALGSGSGPLELPDGLRERIEALRAGDSLPVRLGRTEAEVGSALALRTSTHAALVALAMLRGARLPLANLFYGLRAALLPIAGAVSRWPVYRTGAALGFWAGALLLTARMVTLDEHGPTDLGLLVSADALAAVVTAVAVLGIVAVPAIRMRPLALPRSLVQGVVGVALLLSSGVGALAAAHFIGDVDWPHVIVAPGADTPPKWILVAGMVLLAGPIAARFAPGVPDLITSKPWAGRLSFVLLMAVVAIVGVTSLGSVLGALDDGGWRSVVAVAAVVVAPLVAIGYAWVPPSGRRLGL